MEEGECGPRQFKRNNYFYGKLMTVRDFEDEQEYFNSRRYLLQRPILMDLFPPLAPPAEGIATGAKGARPVLSRTQRAVLREIGISVRAARARWQAGVYDAWGFAGRSSRGPGISALFTGPGGTGKTVAAEVLAADLNLDLYRIDLSSVVSKYIGETEKNLRRLFDAAEVGAAILLFDEADALFGKRSEVKDSHDRYACMEVHSLLQRMEAYKGLTIFSVRNEEALNPSCVSRIRYIIRFPKRGNRILSDDAFCKYVNVRRLITCIEQSIAEGTQWVVFEPNDEKLWARVRATITQFLTRVWKDGALVGTRPEDAFFVKCDRTTMTQDDIDHGRLVCIIGIAPVKPAEFVIFRVAQSQGGSVLTE
jgi:hypothetical protein